MRRVMAFVLLACVALGVVAIGQSVVQTCSVQAFFASPHVDGVIESELITLLGHATSTIDIAMYSFTNDCLGDAVKAASGRGVKVRIILEGSRAKEVKGEYERVLEGKENIRVLLESISWSLLHHKFTVIDGQTVITGSYNWSVNAYDDNFENIVVIQCPEIAAAFTSEFKRVWKILEAGGIP